MRGTALLLAALFLSEAVSAAQALEGCAVPVAGASAGGVVRTQSLEGGPDILIHDAGGAPLVLRGDRLVRWPWLGSGEDQARVINTADGRHFLILPQQGGSRVLTRAAETGRYTVLLDAPYAPLWVDPVTARIFARDGARLLEWDSSGWTASPLALRADGLPGAYAADFGPVRYLTALRAWMALQDGALWLRHDGAADWERISTVQTWRETLPEDVVPRVYHDHASGLAVLQIDVAVLVFDLSGPRPEFLSQYMVQDHGVAQAGQGRVLIELMAPGLDAGWFESAPALRMVTRDGAWPVPGGPAEAQPNPDRDPEMLPVPARYTLRPLGAGVMIRRGSRMALFDGRTLIGMPGLAETFPDAMPEVLQTGAGIFLVGGGVWRWQGADAAEPVIAPDGSQPQHLMAADDLLVFQGEESVWLSEDGQALLPVPVPEGDVSLLAPVPDRAAVLAEIGGAPHLLRRCGGRD